MALKYLPPLPEGLHPFYCIYYCNDNNYSKQLCIVSSDVPLVIKYTAGTFDYGFTDSSTNQMWDKKTGSWVEGLKTSYEGLARATDYKGNIIYTNSDIMKSGSIFVKKSVDATEIIIEGGDIRNMQKGMVWNVGEAISISPPEAPQICTFSSSNPDVCTVDEAGKIVAVGEGECIITITSKM
ncbi:hypothetical protein [Clostridium perfringens]|uniref:hypothetical protein n=1 Tax=Clostridium perfringens TaxID=1502 RepID=UPI003749F73F